MTEETGKNCPTLVPGFHKRAHKWYADLVRGEGDVTGETTDCKISILRLIDRSMVNWYLSPAGTTCELRCQKSFTPQHPERIGCGRWYCHGLPAFARSTASI